MTKNLKEWYSNIMNAKRKGFTLVEFIVVVAMIAILSAILIPNFAHFNDRIEADKQMVEVKDVFLATDTVVDRYWNIEEARESLFRDGRPHVNLVKELASATQVPKSKLDDYEFSIDTEDRLVVKYKDFAYNGEDKYKPEGGGIVVKPDLPVEPEPEPPVDDSLVPGDSEWAGTEDGKFTYIGSRETVIIPKVIKGVSVTSYKGMFEGTSVKKVVSTNLNITDMSYMFSDSRANTLDLSQLNTTNVTRMAYMFTKTTMPTLDLSNFNTERTTDMEGMFYRSKVQNLDVSSFVTDKVRNMSYMFNIDENFTPSPIGQIDLSMFDTSKATMRSMFKNRKEILGFAKSIEDANRLNASHDKPANLRFIVMANDNDFEWITDAVNGYTITGQLDTGYYRYIGSLNEIGIPKKINGAIITNFTRMFENTTVDRPVSYNPNIINMNGMFYGSKAPKIYLDRIDTRNIKSTSEMFANALTTELVGFKTLNTSKVINMSGMFMNSNLNVSFDDFDVSNVINASKMFEGWKRNVLKLNNFDTANITNTTDMFKNAKATKGYAGTQDDADKLNASSNRPETLYFVVMAEDEDFTWVPDNVNGYSMAGRPNVGYWAYNGAAREIEIPEKIYGVNVTHFNRMMIGSKVTKVISYNPNIVSMKGMFYNSQASYIDLKGTNTNNVKDMSEMFYGVAAQSINLTGVNTSNVTNMRAMFQESKSSALDISKLNTSSVTDMSSMFKNNNMANIDVKHFNTTNVTNISNMFEGYKGNVLELTNFNLPNLTTTANAFKDAKSTLGYAKTQAEVNKLNASSNKPNDLYFVVMAKDSDFSGTKNGEFVYIGTDLEIEVPNIIKGIQVTSYNGMFKEKSVIKVDSYNTNIIDTVKMFENVNIDKLDLSRLNASNVRDMSEMFTGATITSINLSKLNTSSVTDMNGMFSNATISTLDISKLDTGNVLDMSNMFKNVRISSLLGLETRTVDKLSNANGMFQDSQLSTINLNGWNTLNLVNMSNMFLDSKATSILGHQNLNVSKVTNMSNLFKNSKLSVIDVSKWNTSKAQYMQNMFDNVSKVDGIEKLNLSSAINISEMLLNNKNIVNLDLSSWRTPNLVLMNSVFENATNLNTINVKNWDTSKVTSMNNLFAQTDIRKFDLTDWDTSKLVNKNKMFAGVKADVGFSKTQADADKLNASSEKPAKLIFGVPSLIKFINDGDLIFEKIIATGNLIPDPIPMNPEKEGYTFIGWFSVDEPTGGTEFRTGALVTAPVTYYARYVIQPRTFTFDSNGGENLSRETITKNFNTTVGILPTVSKEGYTFSGWFTSRTGGTKLTTTTPMRYDTTYYAQWVIQPRTFTFDGNEGEKPTPTTIVKDFNSEVGTLPTVEKEGHLFQGWFTAKTGGTQLTTDTKMRVNTTYYAQWQIDIRTFTFIANGGTNLSTSTIVKFWNTPVGTLPTVSRTGYTFQGWFTQTTGGTKLETNVPMKVNTTYYAQWNINEYSLTVNPNGGLFRNSDKANIITKNYKMFSTIKTPKRVGHTFKGWTESGVGDIIGTGDFLPNRSTLDIESSDYWRNNVVVYNNTHNGTVTHESINANGQNEWDSSLPNSFIRIKSNGLTQSPVRGGFYTSTTTSANKVYYQVIVAKVPIGSTVNNYNNAVGDAPKFTWLTSREGTGEVETYVLKLETSSTGNFRDFGHIAISSSEPVLTWDVYYTHVFDGTDVNSSKLNSEIFVFDHAGDKTITAKWQANPYTVTFDSNGGSNVNSRDIIYGNAIGTLPNSEKAGHTFLGWFTERTGGEKISETTKPLGEKTYYAQWRANEYTVTFNGNGGTDAASRGVIYGTAIGTLPTSTRTGYTFTGWFTQATGGTKVTESTKPMGAQIYYAQWSINSYVVSFNSNGGTSVPNQNVNYLGTISVPSNPVKVGHTFTSWTPSVTTKITQDTTFTANWSINNYTIDFNTVGGSKVNSITQSYGSTIPNVSNPTREGYDFLGWDVTIPTTMPANNLTITAQWKIQNRTVTFNPAEGTVTPTTITVSYGSSVELPNPIRTDYIFEGWYTASTGGTLVSSIPSLTVNTTLYATWKPSSILIRVKLPGRTALTQTHSVSVPGVKSAKDITVVSPYGGNATIQSAGNNLVNLQVSGASSYTRSVQTGGSYTPEQDKYSSTTQVSYGGDNNPSSVWQNDGGYSGYLFKDSTSTGTYQTGGSYTPADTKYVSGQTSSWYNSGGYSGSLSSYLYSGSYTAAQSKTATDYRTGYYQYYWAWVSSTQWGPKTLYRQVGTPFPNAVSYNSDGFTGTLYKNGGEVYERQETANWDRSSPGNPSYATEYYRQNYSGTVTKPASDTRVYRYDGYVTKPASDTRTYGTYYIANYSGTLTKPASDTRTYDYYYDYEVEFKYTK